MPIEDRSFKRLTTENVDKAPRKRGVYAIYEDKKLVFLGHAAGEADTIRSRLRGHLRTAKKGTTPRYKREPSKVPAVRLKQLLDEYVKAHGALPARNASA